MQKRLFHLAALVALLSGGLGACESDVNSKLALAGLSSRCRINSDCSSELACVFQRCHEQCSSSRDCDRGSRCVAGERGRSVCQLEDEAACSDAGTCHGAELCGVDGQCRDGCSSDSGCLSEQVCRAGTCADQDELDPQGALVPSPDRPATPTPCAFASDCPDNLVCRAGRCVAECANDAECGAGESCLDGRCQTAVVNPSNCLRSSDCKQGEQCLAGACQPLPTTPRPACAYDSDCEQAGEHCQAGVCRCECAANQDCASDQVCGGGCQCVAGRVISGDFMVSNSRQLEELANVIEITGLLTFNLAGFGEYHVPNLRKVGAIAANEHKAALVFDALERVERSFQCSQDCRAPRLKWAGSLTFHSESMHRLELPSLETTGDVYIGSSPLMERVSMPQLKTAKNLRLEANQTLTSIDLPLLSTVDSLAIAMAEKLQTISLPLANPSAGIAVIGLATLKTLALPSASTLSGDLSIGNNPLLESVDLSGLKQTRDFSISNAPILTQLSLPNLSTTRDFSFSSSSGPTVLDLPSFGSGRSFALDSLKGVASVNAPVLQDLGDLKVTNTELTALDLPVETMTGGVSVLTNSKLTRVSLPNVTALTTLYLVVDPSLTTMALPALESVSDLAISATALTNLDSITLGLGGALEASGPIRMNDNDALPICAIFALQTALLDKGWTDTLDQAGNLGCNCAGCACNGAVCQ
ncbi:MAG TPA: hypothetical protein VHB79_21910 [Polyangiaceae bacterium]|nr:hypothetical protein [Polyangiaceae bacterium]